MTCLVAIAQACAAAFQPLATSVDAGARCPGLQTYEKCISEWVVGCGVANIATTQNYVNAVNAAVGASNAICNVITTPVPAWDPLTSSGFESYCEVKKWLLVAASLCVCICICIYIFVYLGLQLRILSNVEDLHEEFNEDTDEEELGQLAEGPEPEVAAEAVEPHPWQVYLQEVGKGSVSLCTIGYMQIAWHTDPNFGDSLQPDDPLLDRTCCERWFGGKKLPRSVVGSAAVVVIMAVLRAVQVVLPSLLVYSHYKMYKQGPPWASGCPGTAETSPKITMFFVCVMYASRLYFRALTQAFYKEDITVERPGRVLHESALRVFMNMDKFFETFVEGTTFIMNLAIIYITVDVQEMIANCLYMEFITQLDDEVTEMYFKVYPMRGADYKLEASRKIQDPTALYIACKSSKLFKILLSKALWLWPFMAIVSIFWLPSCKM